ncbi:MAG: exodeoxyribonuclease V subunit alpha [Methylococcales bacterium]
MLLTPQALQDLLTNWHARRWLRDLDIVFVQFLLDMDANADPLVLLAAALASHQLGRGHICLDLDYCVAAPNDALALPPDGDYQYHKADLPSQQLSGLGLATWLAALRQSALVQAAGSPLLVDGNRLYLRRYRQYELNIAQAIQTRLQETSAVADDFGEHIQALFPQQRVQGPNWQKIACALAARRAFAVITGGPGTGKTWTVVRLLALLQATATHKLRIRLAAPTGKAAARLTEAIRKALPDLPANYAAELPDQASTLHRLLGSRPGSRLFKHNTTTPLHADVVIIDEASMIDVEMMNALLLALKIETRLILLGDKDQLASVEAGSVLGDICQIGAQAGYSQATTTCLKNQSPL